MKKILISIIICILFLTLSIPASAVPVVRSDDLFRTSAAAAYPAGGEYFGYYHAEFNMPSGEIWRAVADIGEQGILYVNGVEVEFRPHYLRRVSHTYQYQTRTVNLETYLNPGETNCIAIFFRSEQHPPMTRFQGKVVMTTGETVLLDMAPRVGSPEITWRRYSAEVPGWTQVGFDDSAWNTNMAPIKAWGRVSLQILERWPGYDGRLVFENPNPTEELLFFDESQDVRIDVVVPEGLSGTIHWSLEKTIKNSDLSDGNDMNEYFSFVASGLDASSMHRVSDNSNVYNLNLGTLSRGVYTLEVYLENGGPPIETRFPEPFVVVRELPLQEYDADELEDGLNLELEAEIDFTDPSYEMYTDWIETRAATSYGGYSHWPPAIQVTQPTIVDKGGGMVYRQTYPDNHAMFAYKYTFQHPGDWYFMVLEYPDDARRWTGVSVSRMEIPQGYPTNPSRSETGIGVITGHKYPLSNEMKEFKWIHLADPGLHTIDVVSMAVTRSAAAKKIRIYHINGHLPALKTNPSNERRIGVTTENPETGMAKTFSVMNPGEIGSSTPLEGLTYRNLNFSMIQIKTQRLLFQLNMMENYAEYMKYMGQNLHAMGTYMYLKEQRFGYDFPDPIKSASLSRDIRDVALRVFELNNIDMFSTIEYIYEWSLVNEPEVSFYGGSAEEYRSRDRYGNADRVGYGIINIVHPRVQEAYFYAMDHIADRFSKSPAWKGFYLFQGPGLSVPLFASEIKDFNTANVDPLDFDYSDVTIAAFEADTGINVPGSGSSRYEDRYNYLTSPSMVNTWINWKANYVRNIILQLRDLAQSYRSDLIVMQSTQVPVSELYYWLVRGTETYTEMMRKFQADPTMYTNDDDVWTGRMLYPTELSKQRYIGPSYAPGGRLDYYTSAFENHVSPEVISAYDTNDKRMVTLKESWQEMNYHYMEDYDPRVWPLNLMTGRLHAKYSGDYSQETFAQAMIGADPQLLIHGLYDVGFGVPHGQEMREFNKVVTALPGEKFQPVLGTGFDTNLAIRELQQGGTYWFYIVNPGYWDSTATLNLNNINSVVDISTGQSISTPGGILSFDLKPYGIKAFRASTSSGDINGYSIQPLSEEHLAHMETIIYLVQEIYPTVSTYLDRYIPSSDINMVTNIAAQAEQDLAVGNYAAAWSKLTKWDVWIIAYNKILAAAEVAPRVRERQTGPLTMTFDGSSSMSYYGPIISYQWNFGDGTTGTGRIVSHQYASPGTYAVSLTVTSSEGTRGTNSGTFVKDVFVSDQGYIEGDLNLDGEVDFIDLIIVASNFGRTSNYDLRADTDGNQAIDIFDIVFVARRFTS